MSQLKWPRKRQTTQVFLLLLTSFYYAVLNRKIGVVWSQSEIRCSCRAGEYSCIRNGDKNNASAWGMKMCFPYYLFDYHFRSNPIAVTFITFFRYINYTLYNWATLNIRVRFRHFSATSKLLCIIYYWYDIGNVHSPHKHERTQR